MDKLKRVIVMREQSSYYFKIGLQEQTNSLPIEFKLIRTIIVHENELSAAISEALIGKSFLSKKSYWNL